MGRLRSVLHNLLDLFHGSGWGDLAKAVHDAKADQDSEADKQEARLF